MYIAKNRKKIFAVIVDISLFIIFFPSKLFHKREEAIPFNNILIVRNDHIGDVIMTLPAINQLREKFKEAKIFLIIGSWSKTLFENASFINGIIIHNASWFSKKREIKDNAFYSIIELVKIIIFIRNMNIDLIVDFRSDLRNIFIFGFLGKCKRIMAYDRTGGAVFIDYFKKYKPNIHEVKKNLNLLSLLNIDDDKIDYGIIQRTNSNHTVKKIVQNKYKKIIISPGSRIKIKNWPVENYIKLIEILSLTNNYIFYLVGDYNEASCCELIMQNTKDNVINLCGKTSLQELLNLIIKCDILIGNDSGIMHLGATTNIQIITLFGPTSSIRYKPYSNKSYIIDGNCMCNKEIHEKCFFIDENGYSRCMQNIEVKSVLSLINKILN